MFYVMKQVDCTAHEVNRGLNKYVTYKMYKNQYTGDSVFNDISTDLFYIYLVIVVSYYVTSPCVIDLAPSLEPPSHH